MVARAEPFYKFAVLNYFVIFMNLIPLLELDGYCILADLIQVPDLRRSRSQFIRHDLFHKIRRRERFTKQESGSACTRSSGVAFTIFSLYWSVYFWETVFGGLVEPAVGRRVTGTRSSSSPGAVHDRPADPRADHAPPLAVAGRRERLSRDPVPARDRVAGGGSRADRRAPDVRGHPGGRALHEIAGPRPAPRSSAGKSVFRQGDRPDAFYVVRKGVLEVVEEDPRTGKERSIRTLGRGESFGELGLVTGAPRAATVRAVEDAEVFEVDKGDLRHLLADKLQLPDFEPTLQQVAELRELPCFASLGTDAAIGAARSGRMA